LEKNTTGIAVKGPRTEKEPLELCDEALFLLRSLPASAWTIYLLGTGPFLLTLLYFWTDMTRGVVSEDRLVSGALALSAMFVWMKCSQSVFAAKMWSKVSGVAKPRMRMSDWIRLAGAQSRIQPWGLVILPVAMVIGIPFAWVYAYFQNATVIGIAPPGKTLHAVAFEQAKLWPRQNHIGLFGITILGAVVCVDVLIMLFLAPQILITFFGVKEIFHPSPWLLANTTFLTLVFSLSYLVFDPLAKAFYTLRCFYGQSLTTGEDLQARLAIVKAARPVNASRFATIAAALLIAAASLSAAEPAKQVTPEQLDQSINETLKSGEYNWRLPRETVPSAEKGGWLHDFFSSIARWFSDTLKNTLEWIGRKIGAFLRWIMPKSMPDVDVGGFSLPSPTKIALSILVIVLFGLLYIWLKQPRRKKVAKGDAVATVVIPDLAREDVTADQLPEDEWLALATKLAGEGELRLAIRALFLSALATMAGKQWITLAIFKSNRDYERELKRRAGAIPQALSAFGVLTSIYNRIWYGLKDPSAELLAQCQENLRVLKS
jgi:hypothetical protein